MGLVGREAGNDRAMIEEILPGLVQWSSFHDGIGHTVYSAFELRSATLIDPMEPEERLPALAALADPERIVLTNRHHYRHSARFTKHFECPVLCHENGLDDFSEGQDVTGFSFGEQLAGGVRALELGSICAEETALALEVAHGALCFGDGVTREHDGSLAFMPDRLLGDDPRAVRQGLCEQLQAILDTEFEALLFAHAEPILSGGKALLSEFLSRQEEALRSERTAARP
jgi:hypothetical protein